MSEEKVKVATFVYHGPPVTVVATGEQVEDGDEVTGPVELEFAMGFEKKKNTTKTETVETPGDEK